MASSKSLQAVQKMLSLVKNKAFGSDEMKVLLHPDFKYCNPLMSYTGRTEFLACIENDWFFASSYLDNKKLISKNGTVVALNDLKVNDHSIKSMDWFELKSGKIIEMQSIFDPRNVMMEIILKRLKVY